MKSFHCVTVAALFAIGLHAETLPPPGLLAKWSDLDSLGFSNWRIKSFKGWDIAGDGGSKGFFFETSGGEQFDILAANPAYWTEDEKKLRKQVFFLIYKTRFYRVTPDSKEERILIDMLTEARPNLASSGMNDPKVVDTLITRVRDRKPLFRTDGEPIR